MGGLRVMIVDDEQLAVDRLADLLRSFPDVTLCATASNGDDAVAEIRKTRPDLILLDIEMPQTDGFDVVETISGLNLSRPPLIVFATAFPQFASQAFDTGALDFLAKPIRRSRLGLALERAEQAVVRFEAISRLEELRGRLNELRESTSIVEDQDFWMRERGRVLRLSARDIRWIQAEGQYVRLHLEDRTHLLRSSIANLLSKLPPEEFLQIHRSSAVNVRAIESIEASRRGMTIMLKNGRTLPVGRRYRPAVDERFTKTG